MASWILRCPECGTKFKSPTVEGPEFCPNKKCGIAMKDDADEDGIITISAPFIRSGRMKAADDVYRMHETTSERRVEHAAAMAGVSPSEMSGLKITNMKDNVKPGETYAPEVHNAVTDQMEIMKAKGHQVGFAQMDAAALAGGVRSGPHPNAGAKAIQGVQRLMGRG